MIVLCCKSLGIVHGVFLYKTSTLQPVKDFLFNFVITQHFLGRQTLIQNASSQFTDVDESKIDQLIDQLCDENKIQILDDRAKRMLS
jgi:hypothetical protein